MRGKRTPTSERLKAVARSSRIEAQLPMVASMLSDGRPFLVSDEIGRADLAVYHGLWFLSAMPIDCSAVLGSLPRDQILDEAHRIKAPPCLKLWIGVVPGA